MKVKRSILRWLGHLQTMPGSALSKLQAMVAGEWLSVKWEDRMLEYVREKGERIIACKEVM